MIRCPKIFGKIPDEILPEKTALVLEGGGMRGYFNAGVMDAFLEENIMFPYVIGVSAGAANAFSYVSAQFERNRKILENYVCEPCYISKRNFFKYGSIMNMDFMFRELPEEYIPIDWDSFKSSKTKFKVGCFDIISGDSKWFENKDMDGDITALRASCSLPIICKIVDFKGRKLLDGGLKSPIPIEKSIQDGNEFHFVVLTQNKGYIKKASNVAPMKIMYRKYPELVKTLKNRHENYNKQVEICEKLESEGRAIIIRPQKKICVGRLERDKNKMLDLYFEGKEEALKALQKYRNLQNK